MKEDEKPEHKKPEFIYIDDLYYEEEQRHRHGGGYTEYFESIEKLEHGKYPWFLRILTFALSIGLVIWSLILLFICLGFIGLNLITLKRFEHLGKSAKSYRKMLGKTLVFALGCFVAALNPPFGFGIIILYFMMLGEKLNKEMMEKMTNIDL